jgi:ATP-dependent DNA ligase
VFDLLRRDEADLTEVPLSQRKQLLMRLVGHEFPCLHPVHAFEDGAKLLEVAERHGLVGIVSTRKRQPIVRGQPGIGSRSNGGLAGGEQ